MRSFLGGFVCALLLLAGGVYLVARYALFPIGADNPPSTLERRLAGMAMDGYADAHAPKQDNPVEPTDANLIAGAQRYEEHCALCHGGAASRISRLRDKFSPPVPQIIDRIPHDRDAFLWWVTKHGTRMTGMPAWDGVLSDDDMWKIIAFVKHSNKLPPAVETAWQQAAAR
jgi:thiosulfate dehydrogenase